MASYAFSPQQMWRHHHFGTVADSGEAADSADPDNDGLVNLVEYAFGLPTREAGQQGLPSWQREGDTYVLTFSPPAGVNGLSYGAEYTTSLKAETWATLPNQGTAATPRFVVPALEAEAFFRIRITAP